MLVTSNFYHHTESSDEKSINDQLVEIYYFVNELSEFLPEFAQWRESNNSAPKFSDVDVITIALMRGAGAIGKSVLVSNDNGETWEAINTGFSRRIFFR